MSDFDHSGSGAVVTGGASGVGEGVLELVAAHAGTGLTVADLEAASGPDPAVLATG